MAGTSPAMTKTGSLRSPDILLRGAAGGDDLVGSAAGQLGHVVELEGEGAGAGGRRADFNNQVADLGFGHFGAHHVPAVPALARVEAEDLAAPAGHQGVDLGG